MACVRSTAFLNMDGLPDIPPVQLISKSKYYILFLSALAVYIIGLLVKVMEVDAAQYASISREMLNNHSDLKVFDHGKNYLDKPPLLFWLNVLSFKIFGVSTVSYKLASFLFTLIGVYSTYRLARYLYDVETGRLAALILFTSQAFFLFNNDVRTDTLLTAFVIFSCWQLVLFADSNKLIHLLAGFAGVAFAMMSKGPIGAVIPAAALAAHFVIKREWRKFFKWQWIAGILLTLVLLLPMVIGLQQQFGNAGPAFFFWTQSFGRITGENTWKNDAGFFYFVHVFMWSFLPWSVIVASAFIFSIILIFRSRFRSDALTEYYSLGGFLLPYIALSLSHYKLPHYIFVLYPLASVFTAAFMVRRVSGSIAAAKAYNYIQILVSAGMLAMGIIICTLWFPLSNAFLWLVPALGVVCCIWWWMRTVNPVGKLVVVSAVVAIVVNFLLDVQVYPSLLKYQSGSELARIATEHHVPKDSIYCCNYGNYSFDFYFGKNITVLDTTQVKNQVREAGHFWLLAGDDVLKMMNTEHLPPKRIYATDDYHVTTLSLNFLNRTTRAKTLSKVYLIQF